MAKKHTTHTGTFRSFRWRSPEGDRIIGYLEDGICVLGPAEDGDLVPGITYTFYGEWKEHDTHGKQFQFRQMVVKEPHGRAGVIAYLERYAVGVGPAIASRIWDTFGADSVAVLRTQPDSVVAVHTIGRYLTLEKAHDASRALSAIAELEDTRIALVNLFQGRGFPGALVQECIDKWRLMAPAWIKRDPFCMLVNGMVGCGFARCDRLYIDLGLPPERLKRQTICLWHCLHSDTSGSTWLDADRAATLLGQLVSGVKLETKRAILLGCRSGWLARRRDEHGKLWLAEGERARSEAYLAAKLTEVGRWQGGDGAPSLDESDEELVEA